MKLCYNSELLENPLPEKLSELFKKTEVLEFDPEENCFIFDSEFKKKVIETAIYFYEAPKPFSDDDIALFRKYKKNLYKLSRQLNLPSLQNFTGYQISPNVYKPVSTRIEDEIIIFGEQDFNHHYTYKKSQFPTFPTFKFTFKTKTDLHGNDKFMRLYHKYQSLQKQVNELEENLQNYKKQSENKSSTEISGSVSDSLSETEESSDTSKKTKKGFSESSSSQRLSANTPKLKRKYAPKIKALKEDEKLHKLKNPFNKYNVCEDDISDTSSSNSSNETLEPSDSSINPNNLTKDMDNYILTTYKNLTFKDSKIPGSSYGYSSSLNDQCGKVDILSNTDGWFYQSADKQHQYVMFKFSSPIVIDYYFIMTYALPKNFAHLKKWRLVTLKENEDKKINVINIDERETMELNGPNRMCGFHVEYDQPVDNIIMQMIGENVFQNYRFTLQNIYFSTIPPLQYSSPFYAQ